MSNYQPAPQQPSPYTGAPVPASERYNTLSIVAFVLVFVVSLGAVVCGFIALNQIKRTGEKGHGLALAAVILGFAGIAVGVIITIVYIAIFATAASNGAFSN